MTRSGWLLLAACATAPTTIASKPPPEPPSRWAKILRQGASWRMHSDGMADITIAVVSVTTTDGVTTAQLQAASENTGVDAKMIMTVTLDARGVRLGDQQFPVDGKPVRFPDGRYVIVRDREICYGQASPDCDHGCDAYTCIDDVGISSQLGMWWPNSYVYRRDK